MLQTKFHTQTKTTGRIVALNILNFTFLDSRREDRRLDDLPYKTINIILRISNCCYWTLGNTVRHGSDIHDRQDRQPESTTGLVVGAKTCSTPLGYIADSDWEVAINTHQSRNKLSVPSLNTKNTG
jgi:hypothetical protein